MVSEAATTATPTAAASAGEKKQKQKDGQGAGDQEAELMDFAFGSSMVLEGDDVTFVKVRAGGGVGYYEYSVIPAAPSSTVIFFVFGSLQKGRVPCCCVLLYV